MAVADVFHGFEIAWQWGHAAKSLCVSYISMLGFGGMVRCGCGLPFLRLALQ